MEWPTVTRRALWAERFEQAKHDYAEVANAVAAFEPVVMVCDPEQEAEARRSVGSREILPLPIDDSWMRDNGPIFVRDAARRVALVHFRFNSWGERFLRMSGMRRCLATWRAHLGMRRYEAPFVLEGGSFFVDGEGTLITTEQCLLNPNRNPSMSREQIEKGSAIPGRGDDRLARSRTLHRSRHRRSHRGIAHISPRQGVLLMPDDPEDPDHEFGRENRERLGGARDARGRRSR